jgi:hypothetical protein
MSRSLFAAAAFTLAAAMTLPTLAEAQSRRPTQGQGGGDADAEAKRAADKKRDSEWKAPNSRLPGQRNAGPCPFVKVLYDAARYVEFEGQREASASVGYTGEIEGISAGCSYQDDEPITVSMNVGFAFGRGPQADGSEKVYDYWVAVTRRNQEVLAKEHFRVPVRFAPGQDRVVLNETLEGIVIPRASLTTSGSNFEILVGFEVTPEMAAFNRDGKRFRVNVAPVQAAAATPPSTAQ